MKIKSVNVKSMNHKLVRNFYGSSYVYTHKNIITIEAKTDEGINGYCYLGDDFSLGKEITNIFNTKIKPILIGRNPIETEEIWNDLRPTVRDIFNDRRASLHAQALADAVCWDIVGKVAEKPLAQLLGNTKPSLPVIAIGGYYGPKKQLSDLIKETRELIKLGFMGMKLKVGGLTLEEDIARVKAVRETGGNSFMLAVDANQAWSLTEAKYFIDAIVEEELLWVEEPVHWDNDINDLAKLKKNTNIKICAGQSEWTTAGLKRLIDSHAVDICNLHPSYCGGITPWLKGAQYAIEKGLIITNTGEPQLSSNLMLGLDNTLCVEMYHPDRDPIVWKQCPIFKKISKGRLPCPNLFGWGLEKNKRK